MGASINKPLRNGPTKRSKKFIPRWKRNESAFHDSRNQQVMYEDHARDNNLQDGSGSFWENQHHYNEEGYGCDSNNSPTNNYMPSEAHSQFANTEYDERCPPNFNTFELGNYDQSHFNENLTYSGPEYSHDYTADDFQGYLPRVETEDYNYDTVQPFRRRLRCNSLNNDYGRPQFNTFYQNNNRFQVQSYSLNNIDDGATYYGFQNNKSSFEDWSSISRINPRMRRFNSTIWGISGAGNSLNNDFGGPTYIQSNHRYQVQSLSLSNINDMAYYDNIGSQNNNFSVENEFNGINSSRLTRYNSANSVSKAGKATQRGGKKRNSMDEEFYGEDFYASATPDDCGIEGDGSNIDFLSYVGPKVKRRSTCDSHEENFSERSNSALSSRNHTPSNCSGETDFACDDDNLQPPSEGQSNVIDILQFPSAWSSYAMNKTGYVNIPSTSLESEKLCRYFHKTSRSRDFQLRIEGITRIENPFLHTLFLMKKEEMKLRNGHVDELHLYHGTKKIYLQEICENNLNWRVVNAHKFGHGVSFSPLATYSSHYCDNSEIKVMLLFKVLVSNTVDGSSTMEIPPIIDSVKYDTSIKENISVIVKYSDNEFYPLYKIAFTRRCVKTNKILLK